MVEQASPSSPQYRNGAPVPVFGVWHGFVFMAPDSIAFEIKPGPYDATLDKEFAPWSPREDAPEATDFVRWMGTATVGERWVP